MDAGWEIDVVQARGHIGRYIGVIEVPEDCAVHSDCFEGIWDRSI